MPSLVYAIVLSVIFGMAQLMLVGYFAQCQRGFRWAAGSRDQERDPLTGVAARLERAQRNFFETYPFFAALAVVMLWLESSHGVGLASAWVYLLARVIYLPLYALGVANWRSLAWLVAMLSLLGMSVTILWL